MQSICALKLWTMFCYCQTGVSLSSVEQPWSRSAGEQDAVTEKLYSLFLLLQFSHLSSTKHFYFGHCSYLPVFPVVPVRLCVRDNFSVIIRFDVWQSWPCCESKQSLLGHNNRTHPPWVAGTRIIENISAKIIHSQTDWVIGLSLSSVLLWVIAEMSWKWSWSI